MYTDSHDAAGPGASTIFDSSRRANLSRSPSIGVLLKSQGIDASTAKLNEVLDSDEGARFIGEFAIGFNPMIREPMLDILFDEKIAGSFHFTPGQAYEEADNGNRSEIHWDLVCIQRPDFGGGEIRFDDETIRKDGIFVVDDLLDLNPDRLG